MQPNPGVLRRTFEVNVPSATLDRILSRVRDTRLPDRLDASDWRYGADWQYMKDLLEYWGSKFDWRKAEANLNRYPQFTASIDGYEIHFYYVRGSGPQPIPLILSHGWPGSVFEFLEAIGPLTESGFDVVVPSLPGFGFSSKPRGRAIGPPSTARLWHKLMTEILGYDRFAAQGGDWGTIITTQLAQQFPKSLIGIHLNGAAGRNIAIPADEVTQEERAWQQAVADFRAREGDYFGIQQNKPQTVSFALHDNPVGTAAWIVEKFKGWSDSGNNLDETLTKDQVLTNIMIYLVTETSGTSAWYYRGLADDPGPAPTRIEPPMAFAAFPREMAPLNPPESTLRRVFNVVRYTRMPRGGHFACLEQPKLLVDDIHAFFQGLR